MKTIQRLLLSCFSAAGLSLFVPSGILYPQAVVNDLSVTNGTVYAIAYSGSTIYIGGDFTTVGGETRNRIAAIDASTGAVTSWNPGADDAVTTLAVSGSTVYAGGHFTTIGGQARNYIAALDASTGTATTWNPDASLPVRALAVSGSTVYVIGDFSSIGGQTRNRIAALDSTSPGNATTWDPDAGTGYLFALAVSGSTVYVGGNFTTIGEASRNYIAAIDVSTGLPTSWNPDADGAVEALAVSGSTVYVGGVFTTFGGEVTRNYIAAIDSTSPGFPTTWNSDVTVGGEEDGVFAIAVSGSTVYVGGSFTGIGDSARNNIAAIDSTTSGGVTTWDPNANGSVNAIALDFTNARVYVGGAFTDILSSGHSYFAGLTNPDDADLPVEMVSCAASVTGKNVELRWTTATEVDNAGWKVERKDMSNQPSATSWADIGFVAGSGTSTGPKQYSYVDQDVAPGRYAYRLKQMDRSGTVQYWNEVQVEVGNVPLKFALHQNYPNPFNPSTTIQYALPEGGRVTLKVFDLLGREVATLLDEVQEAGYKSIQFESSKLSSGMYLYRLRAGNAVQTRKMVVLR
jgi:hypothetical protein